MVCILAVLLLSAPAGAAKTPSEGGAPSGSLRAQNRGASVDTLRGFRLRKPLAVHGGRVLSTGDARRAIPQQGGAELSAEQARQALRELGNRLIEEGYLEADLHLVAVGGGDAALEVTEGPRARWDTLRVLMDARRDTLAAHPAGLLPPPRGIGTRLPLPDGGFRPERFEKLLDEWVDLWTEHGHPFASATIESLVVRGGRVRAGIRLDPGPRLSVSEVSFPGRTGTRESFLRRWIRFRPDGLFRESDWEARRRRLEQSGLFLRVGDAIPEQIPEGGMRVLLPVEERKHNDLEGALGYAGATRTLSGYVDLSLGDLFGTGRSFGVRWERLRQEQSRLLMQYHEPMLGALPVGASLSLSQEVQDTTYTLLVWEGTLEGSIGWDLTAFAGGEYRRSLYGPQPSELTTRFSTLFGGRWDTMSPGRWRGGRLEASFRSGVGRVRPQGGGATVSQRLDRASIEAERYWPLGQLLLRGHFKAEALSRSDSLAPTEALRIGGGNSIRGYSEEQFPTRRYGIGQLEIGVGMEESRVYAFVDAGWYRSFAGAAADHVPWGVGVGMSTESASRRVALDLGLPRGGTLREARLHVRVETRF